MSAGFPRGGSVYGIVARVLGAVCAVCLICLPLLSQTNQGTIQGGVFDQTGGAVAGATVSVVDVARGVTRTLTTDGAGQYIANALTPGTYTCGRRPKASAMWSTAACCWRWGKTFGWTWWCSPASKPRPSPSRAKSPRSTRPMPPWAER